MSDVLDVSVADRLGKAVYQNSAFSVDGLLERIFANAFKGLVYPQIWEDPEIDMEALAITSQDNLVCIASGSCNTMSYLTANPASITSVDLSPAHVALGNLKKVAAQTLPDQQAFFQFFGAANRPDNPDLYYRYVAEHLDQKSRDWWETSGLFSSARINGFSKDFYRQGLLGRFIGSGHFFARILGVDVRKIGDCKDNAAQIEFFENKIAPLFDKKLVRFLTSQRASLFGLGIPPAQYDALVGESGDMAEVLKERTRKLACDFPLKDNYFAWQAFMRHYDPAADGARPPYLTVENFESVRANAERITVLNESFTDHLQTLPSGSRQGYVLLDAQDWMTDEQLNALWSEITRTAAPGARVIFRTAAEPTLLPGRVTAATLSQWDYRKEASAEWTKRDRSAIYGGFHLYVKKG